MSSRIRVLIVEDVATDAGLVVRELEKAGIEHQWTRVETEADFRRSLDAIEPDIILSDFSMPKFDGLSALEISREKAPDTPFIFVSGTIGEEIAIESLKRGAVDYILKTNLKRLAPAVRRALQDVEERRARLAAERQFNEARIRFELFMRYLPGAAFIKDWRGRYQFVNWSWEENHGDVLGRTDGNLWPELAAQFEISEQLVLEKNDVLRSVETFPRPDGVHHYMLHRFPILDHGGQSTLVGGIALDITERIQLEAKLQERDAALHRAQHMARLAHVITGPDGTFESWSETFPELIGMGAVEMPKSTREWLTILHPGDREIVREKSAEAGAKGSRLDIEYRLRRADDSWIQIRQVIEPIQGRDDADGRSRWFNTFQDVTEQKRAQEKIERLNRVYAVLSGINTLIVRVRDRQELFDGACRIAVEHGGFGIAWIGKLDSLTLDITPVASAGVDVDMVASLRLSARSDIPRGQGMAGQAVRGKKAAVSNDIASAPNVGGAGRQEAIRRGYSSIIALPLLVEGTAVGILSLIAKERDFFNANELKLLEELAGDISFALEHISKEERLNYIAYYDQLTGLPNRTLMQDYLGRVVRRAREEKTNAAVVMCDVNRFSFVNETLGRKGGDALLREIGQRLRTIWPESDNVARLSGKCFGGIVANIKDASEIAHLVEKKLANVFDAPFAMNGREFRVSMTTGIAVFPSDGDDSDTLLRNAEAAVKKAKAGGHKYLFYHAKMNAAVAEMLIMENKLRVAIEREEFTLHYQPKVDLANGQISGLEALIRWNDPGNGLIAPAKFIPLLEETGLILEVGAWAIRKALADHRAWHMQGLQPPRIAVNVSSIQLRQSNFVDTVRNVIGESKSTVHGLDLEITESLIMEDIESNTAKLKALREMGVNIAIDDFGTGYSSLRYLARLPVNLLKIDRSFIINMTKEAESMAIVSTIISLAHSLKMKVIAEGVELEEQSRSLRLLKCDEMQGYLFSKPLPMEQLTKMLEKSRGN